MKSYFTLLFTPVVPFFGTAQIYNTVKGKIVNSETLRSHGKCEYCQPKSGDWNHYQY